MDPNQQVTTQPQITPEAPKDPPNGGLLSWILKLFIVIIIALILIGGGFYVGAKAMKQSVPKPTPVPSPTPNTLPTQVLPSPTSASENTKSVTGGLTGHEIFYAYTVAVPKEWIDTRETTVAASLDKITLTKNGYSVTIYQAPMEGSNCVYPEGPASTFAQTFKNFVDINGQSAKFRRSWDDQEAKTITYSVCQQGPDGNFGTITNFGAITVVAPNPPSQAMLTEIDGIVASLKKQ